MFLHSLHILYCSLSLCIFCFVSISLWQCHGVNRNLQHHGVNRNLQCHGVERNMQCLEWRESGVLWSYSVYFVCSCFVSIYRVNVLCSDGNVFWIMTLHVSIVFVHDHFCYCNAVVSSEKLKGGRAVSGAVLVSSWRQHSSFAAFQHSSIPAF